MQNISTGTYVPPIATAYSANAVANIAYSTPGGRYATNSGSSSDTGPTVSGNVAALGGLTIPINALASPLGSAVQYGPSRQTLGVMTGSNLAAVLPVNTPAYLSSNIPINSLIRGPFYQQNWPCRMPYQNTPYYRPINWSSPCGGAVPY